MVISDEISDFGNMNFRFRKYEFQICQFAYEEWRIESTRAYFPDGFHEARIGPKGTKSHRSVKFGNRGSFLVRKVPKNTCLCYLICESNEYQMKICHMENISNLSCWKKNSRLFRFSFGDSEPRHETHSGDTHDEPFRWYRKEIGIFIRIEEIFWWSQISLEILRRQNMTRNEREIPRPVLCRAESKKCVWISWGKCQLEIFAKQIIMCVSLCAWRIIVSELL